MELKKPMAHDTKSKTCAWRSLPSRLLKHFSAPRGFGAGGGRGKFKRSGSCVSAGLGAGGGGGRDCRRAQAKGLSTQTWGLASWVMLLQMGL